MTWWKQYAVSVPEGKLGPWTIDTFTVDEDAMMSIANLRLMRDGRGLCPGTYTRLKHAQRGVVMSDTPAEVSDHLEAIKDATGHVLVAGLGLGMVAQAMLRKPEVLTVRVMEVDPDVIALVGPHYMKRYGGRLIIERADVVERCPNKGERYDYAWWDIWDSICGDNWPEMKALKARWKGRIGKQRAWGQELCRRAFHEWPDEDSEMALRITSRTAEWRCGNNPTL